MALSAQIEPVNIFNETGVTLCCEILHYDLLGVSCEVNWWLLDQNDSQIYSARWFATSAVMEAWGIDDSVIIEGLASDLGFTIVTG